MASSTPWYTPSLYACFSKWSSDQSRCIAPVVADNNRRCKFGNDSDAALRYRTIAEGLPPGTERDSAIRDFILLLCCERGTHRSKLGCDKYGVLTTLVGHYGCELQSKSSMIVKKEVDPVLMQHASNEAKLPMPKDPPRNTMQYLAAYKARPDDTVTVRRELYQNVDARYQAVGQVYCATWQGMPGFVKIGYTGSSAMGRVADQEKCFPGIRLEASFRFEFPEKIERLLHRELRKYRHEIVICNGCDRGHIEWFKFPTTSAIDIMSDWYKLTQKEPLYDSDRKLRMSWSIKLVDMIGDLTATDLLDTFSDGRTARVKDEKSLLSIAEPSATAAVTELTAQLRMLTEQLKSSKVSKIDLSRRVQTALAESDSLLRPVSVTETAQKSTSSDIKAEVLELPNREPERETGTSFPSLLRKTTSRQSKPEMSLKENLALKKDSEVRTVPMFTPTKPQILPGLFPLTPPTTIQKPLPDFMPSGVATFSFGKPQSKNRKVAEMRRQTAVSTNSFAPYAGANASQKLNASSTPTSLLTPNTCSASGNTDLADNTPTKLVVSEPPTIFSSRNLGPTNSRSTIVTASANLSLFSFGKESKPESSKAVNSTATKSKATPFFEFNSCSNGSERPRHALEESALNGDVQGLSQTLKPFKFSAGIPPLDFNTPASTLTSAPGWSTMPEGLPTGSLKADGWKIFTSRECSAITNSTQSTTLIPPSDFASPPAVKSSINKSITEAKADSTSKAPCVSGLGEDVPESSTTKNIECNPSKMRPVTMSSKNDSNYVPTDSTHDKSTQTEVSPPALGASTTTIEFQDTATAIPFDSAATNPTKQLECRDLPLNIQNTDIDQILTFFSDFMALQAQAESLSISSLAQQVVPMVAAMPGVQPAQTVDA